MSETKTDKPKRKKYKRRKTRLTYGPRGLKTLKLAFQIGGFTAQEHSRFFETDMKNSYRILASLADQRLLEQAPIQTGGRPKDLHYLSKANACRGIVLGGHEAGLHERRSKEQHKLHQLPQHSEHAHARNRFFLELLEASRAKDSGVEVPRDELWGEAHPGFPLRGAKKGERVFPDGLFELRFGEGITARYLIEYESRPRPGEALGKLDSYGAHLRQMLKENPNAIKDWLRPVVFLFREVKTAMNVSNVVKGAVRAEAPELSRYFAWREAAARAGVNAGRLVLFASLDDLEEARSLGTAGALSTRYAALALYEEGAPGVAPNRAQVSLEAAGREVAGAVARR